MCHSIPGMEKNPEHKLEVKESDLNLKVAKKYN